MLEKLSIVIPTYNRNNYLVKLLDTIPQGFNGEVLISDNGNYVTNEIKQSYKDYNFVCPDGTLKMFENWNFALSHVQTEWFVLPSDDDMFCEESFSKINTILEQYPDGDIFIYGHNIIDENDNIKSSWSPKEYKTLDKLEGFKVFMKGIDARCPSIIMRTDMAREMGVFNEGLDFTAADSLLIQKCMLNGKSIFVPEIISSYRVWPNNFTSQLISTKKWLDKIEMWTQEISLILKKDFPKQFSKNKIQNFQDEIYARNFIVGISNKKVNEGRFPALSFVKENRFPFYADFKTKIVLVKTILRACI